MSETGRVQPLASVTKGDALLDYICPLCSGGIAAHRPNRAWSCPLDRTTIRQWRDAYVAQLTERPVTAPASSPSQPT